METDKIIGLQIYNNVGFTSLNPENKLGFWALIWQTFKEAFFAAPELEEEPSKDPNQRHWSQYRNRDAEASGDTPRKAYKGW